MDTYDFDGFRIWAHLSAGNGSRGKENTIPYQSHVLC